MFPEFNRFLEQRVVPLGVCLFLSFPIYAADPPSVLMRLGDVEITTLDIEADLQRMTPVQREQVLERPDGVKRMAGTLLYWRKIALEAEAAAMAADPLVAAQLRINRERLLGELYLLRADLDGVTADSLERLARAEYAANPERFTGPAQVRARHILVSTANRSEAEVQERLGEVSAALAAGKGFEDVATQYSDDTGSAQRGGDLGYFGRGRMVAPFEDAAFRLSEPGDISPPVRTQFGWHLIKLEERTREGLRPFEEIQAQLTAELRAKLVTDKRQQRASAMQNDPGLQVDEAAIEAFAARRP